MLKKFMNNLSESLFKKIPKDKQEAVALLRSTGVTTATNEAIGIIRRAIFPWVFMIMIPVCIVTFILGFICGYLIG